MAITLTDKAAERVRKFIAQRGKGLGLRLGVRTSGCSGLAYTHSVTRNWKRWRSRSRRS